MKFSCEHCGRLLSVAGKQAGRKGRCPHCKNTVTIPANAPVEVAAPADSGDDGTVAAPQSSPRDSLLFDKPPAETAAAPQTTEEAYERLKAMQGSYLLKPREEPPERPLPWVIDIFLYPLNKPGMLILALSTGIPMLLRMLYEFTRAMCVIFAPLYIFLLLLILIRWAVLLMFLLYINWYVAECIRDSAAGGIRAVDTTGSTPGFAELLGQSVTVLACGAVCMAPAIFYAVRGGSDGPLFWVLCGVGGFLFPMALLAVTMFESLRALNPILVLGSILGAFLPYCVLAAFCCVLCVPLLSASIRYLIGGQWVVGFPLLFASFYLLLVLAHLVGRFCWKYEEKLNWDV